jgi:hypothetical protein
MHKLGEQVPSSFCYSVHWINTGIKVFVQRIDKESIKINKILTINNEIGDDKIFQNTY